MKENRKISLLSNSEWQKIRNKYHVPNQGMNMDSAKEILFEVDKLLKELKIEYFLSCGTALGLYRDGDFIPWDDEIDIDIPSEIFVPNIEEIKEKFLNNDFIARATNRGQTSKMSVFKKGVKVAMGAIYDNKKGYRCDSYQKFPIKFYENAVQFEFEGANFTLPGPLDEYLTFYYGDWKTPIKSYNTNEYLNKNGQWRK